MPVSPPQQLRPRGRRSTGLRLIEAEIGLLAELLTAAAVDTSALAMVDVLQQGHYPAPADACGGCERWASALAQPHVRPRMTETLNL